MELTGRPTPLLTTAKPEVEAVYRFNYTTTDQRPLLRKHHHEVRRSTKVLLFPVLPYISELYYRDEINSDVKGSV